MKLAQFLYMLAATGKIDTDDCDKLMDGVYDRADRKEREDLREWATKAAKRIDA